MPPKFVSHRVSHNFAAFCHFLHILQIQNCTNLNETSIPLQQSTEATFSRENCHFKRFWET